MAYAIGEKIWSRGSEVTITSEPYMISGGEFQDSVDENGKAWIEATPEERERNVHRNRQEFKDQQEAFSRLKKAQKANKK